MCATHRVQGDVARQFQQVGILLHEDGFEAPLKYVTYALVLPVVVLGIGAIEEFHALGQGGGVGFN